MLQCKSNNPTDAFVRAVVAAPEPMAVLCTDQQLDDNHPSLIGVAAE